MIFQLLSLNAILSSAHLELKREKQDYEKQVPILKSEIEALKTENEKLKEAPCKGKGGISDIQEALQKELQLSKENLYNQVERNIVIQEDLTRLNMN